MRGRMVKPASGVKGRRHVWRPNRSLRRVQRASAGDKRNPSGSQPGAFEEMPPAHLLKSFVDGIHAGNSVLVQRFIKVQQQAADHRVGGQLGCVQLFVNG